MYDNLCKKIMRLLKQDRDISKVEQKYVVDWKEQLDMKDEIILEAVKRAVDYKGIKASFPYINAILNNWYSKEVKNFSDIIALDEKFRKKKDEKMDASADDSEKQEIEVTKEIRKKIISSKNLEDKIRTFVIASEYAAKLSEMGFAPGMKAERFYYAGEAALELIFREDYDSDTPEEWEDIVRDNTLTSDQKVNRLVSLLKKNV